MSVYSGYTGTKPEKTSALMALTAWIGYLIYGGYFLKAQRFVNALKDFIENNGGKVITNCKVDKIIVEKGKAIGVKVGDRVFKAPVVVSNVNAKTTFLELVGEEHLSKDFVEYIKSLKMSPSAFVVYLGVNMDLSGYPSIIKNTEGYEIAIISNANRSLAPEGKSSLLILTSANYHDFPNGEAYKRVKAEWTERLIKMAERVLPNLSKYIEVVDSATPKTMERYCSMPEGAIYSIDQSINVKRPYFKTPIRGLYLVGASTFPGGGIEAVVISGIICAHDICGWS